MEIAVEVPLLQNPTQRGGRLRNSLGTEGAQWRTEEVNVEPITQSMYWIPSPSIPLAEGDDIRIDHPPIIAPPIRNSLPGTILNHRASVIARWSSSDDASFHLISFNWRDNLSTKCPKWRGNIRTASIYILGRQTFVR